MSPTYDFSGKIAVVTGGANGIGRAIGEHLERCGATVLTWDLVAPPGQEDAWAKVDVSDSSTVAAATEAAVARHGRIDFLINNAGYLGPSMPLDAFDPAEWRRLIEVNLIGVFEVSRHVIPVMKRSKGGRIVNIASIAGKEGTPNATAYSAAKAGVIGLTKALAKELVPYDIRVNAIAPGPIETALLQQATKEHLRVMLSKCPMGRLATPDEAAELVLWLCSPACSFNTGAIFDLSGGRATY